MSLMESMKQKRCTRREMLQAVLTHAAEAGVEAVGRGLTHEVTKISVGAGVVKAGLGTVRQTKNADAGSREVNADGALASGRRRRKLASFRKSE